MILDHPNVIGLRDMDTVEYLINRLKNKVKKVAIVGNGGIALELVHAVSISMDTCKATSNSFLCI